MIQEVKFQGLVHSPSDYNAQDGELGICLNLIPEDGTLKPIATPEVINEDITIPDGASIKLVHKVPHDGTTHSHYIVCRADSTWFWLEKDGNGTVHDIELGSYNVNSAAAVGNIICFVCSSQTIYAFWEKEKSDYTIFSRENFNYSVELTYNTITSPILVAALGDEFSDIFEHSVDFGTDSIKSIPANKVIKAFSALDAILNNKMDSLGKEYLKYNAFMVLAIRLYDGSLYNISNIFKINSGFSTIGEVYVDSSKKQIHTSDLLHSVATYNLKVNIENIDKINNLIQGIDVYITKGESFIDTEKAISDITITDNEHKQGKFYFHYMTPNTARDTIDSMSFYHSAFIDKTQFGETITIKRVTGTEESVSLANLYRSDIGGLHATTYNNRLHIANVYNGNINLKNTTTSYDESSGAIRYNGIIKAETKNNTIWWKGDFYYTDFTFANIPVLEVAKITIFRQKTGTSDYSKAIVTPLSSNTMGYSYYITNSEKYGISFDLPWQSATENEWDNINNEYNSSKDESYIEHSSSLVKVSETENPLVFPASSSVQVGSSTIYALAANTRPISEGQFGDAPLYAFTDEGVWVLMTSSEGTYDARQPVNRDICSNPNSILQIDDAVLFPTERGIMMQQGRESICITDQLDGYPFDYTQLPLAASVLQTSNISESEVKYVNFRKFLFNDVGGNLADMIYDYYGNRIILFNPDYEYAYVYSLKSKQWGAMENTIKARVNIYPEAYAINKDNKIVNMYTKYPDTDVPYFLCSRPLSLSSNEVFKTMFACIARGYFRNEKGKCGMVLYGSNDLFNWFPIKTSVDKYLRGMAGSPYKYFRIALIGSLSVDESITGISTEFQERWQNKLR